MNTQDVALPWPRRLGISVALLLCGLLVFVLGTNYYSVFPTNDSQAYRVILAVVFLGAALMLRRNESAEPYSHIAYAFFVATVTYFVTSLTAGMREPFFRTINVPMDTPLHLALMKVYEVVLVVATILILSKLWGNDLGSLYIKKGRLGLSLFIGISLLVINAATGIVTGAALGRAGDELIAQLPGALVFSLANGFMEELLFRGLFLRRVAAVIGEVGSIIVTSIVFTVMHAAASYMNPAEAILFQVIIFPMALLFAYLMHKTDNVWGAALYHAGSDVFLFYLMAL
jgi:membrane protease YdiL (CAAX protease family)